MEPVLKDSPMTTTYRKQFDKAEKAEEYDLDQYSPKAYSSLLWSIEQSQLQSIVDNMRSTHDKIEYLDFAAGTGRVISFMEDKVDVATGIEISQAMVDRAQSKLTKGTMICKDITPAESDIEGKYDLITTFRFILNAEGDLCQAGIDALAKRLKDENSLLVFNNHGNIISHKLILWPIHKIKGLGKGYRTAGNYMTNKQAHQVADKAGLKIISTVGCGFLGATVGQALSTKRVAPLERLLSKIGLIRPFSVNQLYVAKLK